MDPECIEAATCLQEASQIGFLFKADMRRIARVPLPLQYFSEDFADAANLSLQHPN